MSYFQNASNDCVILKGGLNGEWTTLAKLPFNLAASATTSHGANVFIVGGLASNQGVSKVIFPMIVIISDLLFWIL